MRKYENPFEHPETHKIWLDGNHKPEIEDGADAATFRRLHPIPFTRSFPAGQIDRDRAIKLQAEAEGIISWAVAGAVQWHAHGLTKPSIIRDEVSQWQKESHWAERFLADCCVIPPLGSAEYTTGLHAYQTYSEWAIEHKTPPLSIRTFGIEIKRHVGWKRVDAGIRYSMRVKTEFDAT